MAVKNGLLTTEFLTTLISQVVGALVMLGIMKPEWATNELNDGITQVIVGIMSLVTAIAYIRGRVELKKVEMQTSVSAPTTTTPAENTNSAMPYPLR